MAGVSDEQVQSGRLLRIGELARLAGVTPRAVRFYETQGLLPAPHRSEAGYRLYSPHDLVRVIRVRRLRELGSGAVGGSTSELGHSFAPYFLKYSRLWLLSQVRLTVNLTRSYRLSPTSETRRGMR